MLHKIASENDYKKYLLDNKFAGVYYSSQQCGVCNTMKPQVENVFNNNKAKLVEIVVNEHPSLTAQQLIMTSPTVIFYEKGKEIFRESGFVDLKKMDRNLKMIL